MAFHRRRFQELEAERRAAKGLKEDDEEVYDEGKEIYYRYTEYYCNTIRPYRCFIISRKFRFRIFY
jgi:hypothetical protein